MKGNNQRQGGWIASFIVVGAVLVLGLVGGAYYLKNRADQAMAATPEPATAADNSSKDKSADKPEDKKTSESSQSGSGSSESQNDKEDKSDTALPSSGQSATDSTENAADTTTTLPQTGPLDTMVTTAFVTLLAFAAATYLQSRRSLQ